MTKLLKHAWVKLNAVLVKHLDKYILPLAAGQLLRFLEWLIERSERHPQLLRFLEWLIERSERHPGEISRDRTRQDPL